MDQSDPTLACLENYTQKFCYSPTPYEFTQAWTSMKHIHDTESYAQLIRQIPPNNLAAGIC